MSLWPSNHTGTGERGNCNSDCLLLFLPLFISINEQLCTSSPSWSTFGQLTYSTLQGELLEISRPAAMRQYNVFLSSIHLSCPSTHYVARELILTSCIQMHSNSDALCLSSYSQFILHCLIWMQYDYMTDISSWPTLSADLRWKIFRPKFHSMPWNRNTPSVWQIVEISKPDQAETTCNVCKINLSKICDPDQAETICNVCKTNMSNTRCGVS